MRQTRTMLGIAGLSVLMGLGIGFLLGRFVWPVRYVDVAPADLRPEWQAEYVRMVALAYMRDRDLDLARARLALLGDPVAALEQLPERSGVPLSPTARSAVAELLEALRRSSTSPPSGGSP